MTQFGNLPKRESLLEAVTPVGTYGGVGHFVEYFGGADYDRNLWKSWNSATGGGTGEGTTIDNGTCLNAWQHKGGGVELITNSNQYGCTWLGMGSTQAFDKDGFVMISIATRLSSDTGLLVGMTSNGNQNPRQVLNDASRAEFHNASNPSSIQMRVKSGSNASGQGLELSTSISGTNGAAGLKRYVYQIEGIGAINTVRGSINNVLEVVYTETNQNDYPDDDMSPFCGVYTRANNLDKAVWTYCECWNTGA